MERYRIHPEAAVYFVTYSIIEWLPMFVTEAAFRIVTDSLTFCHRNKHLRINAYVIMPTHMHICYAAVEAISSTSANAAPARRETTVIMGGSLLCVV